jgi:hypothetical protein
VIRAVVDRRRYSLDDNASRIILAKPTDEDLIDRVGVLSRSCIADDAGMVRMTCGGEWRIGVACISAHWRAGTVPGLGRVFPMPESDSQVVSPATLVPAVQAAAAEEHRPAADVVGDALEVCLGGRRWQRDSAQAVQGSGGLGSAGQRCLAN